LLSRTRRRLFDSSWIEKTPELPNGRMHFHLLSIYVQVSLKCVDRGRTPCIAEKKGPGYDLLRGDGRLEWYPRRFS